ncbi:unnamed protein product [Amoebophrya sp. A25]|nr:unnamed protein product [Amoebophrya sp. A25]|eukprot:GSA25T00006448001.1
MAKRTQELHPRSMFRVRSAIPHHLRSGVYLNFGAGDCNTIKEPGFRLTNPESGVSSLLAEEERWAETLVALVQVNLDKLSDFFETETVEEMELQIHEQEQNENGSPSPLVEHLQRRNRKNMAYLYNGRVPDVLVGPRSRAKVQGPSSGYDEHPVATALRKILRAFEHIILKGTADDDGRTKTNIEHDPRLPSLRLRNNAGKTEHFSVYFDDEMAEQMEGEATKGATYDRSPPSSTPGHGLLEMTLQLLEIGGLVTYDHDPEMGRRRLLSTSSKHESLWARHLLGLRRRKYSFLVEEEGGENQNTGDGATSVKFKGHTEAEFALLRPRPPAVENIEVETNPNMEEASGVTATIRGKIEHFWYKVLLPGVAARFRMARKEAEAVTTPALDRGFAWEFLESRAEECRNRKIPGLKLKSGVGVTPDNIERLLQETGLFGTTHTKEHEAEAPSAGLSGTTHTKEQEEHEKNHNHASLPHEKENSHQYGVVEAEAEAPCASTMPPLSGLTSSPLPHGHPTPAVTLARKEKEHAKIAQALRPLLKQSEYETALARRAVLRQGVRHPVRHQVHEASIFKDDLDINGKIIEFVFIDIDSWDYEILKAIHQKTLENDIRVLVYHVEIATHFPPPFRYASLYPRGTRAAEGASGGGRGGGEKVVRAGGATGGGHGRSSTSQFEVDRGQEINSLRLELAKMHDKGLDRSARIKVEMRLNELEQANLQEESSSFGVFSSDLDQLPHSQVEESQVEESPRQQQDYPQDSNSAFLGSLPGAGGHPFFVGMSLQAAADLLFPTHTLLSIGGIDAIFVHNDILPYINRHYGTTLPLLPVLHCWANSKIWFPFVPEFVAEWAFNPSFGLKEKMNLIAGNMTMCDEFDSLNGVRKITGKKEKSMRFMLEV